MFEETGQRVTQALVHANQMFRTAFTNFKARCHSSLQSVDKINSYPNMPDLEMRTKDTLAVLETTQHVLIQKPTVEFAENFVELRNRFDLLNTDGDNIFFGGEALQLRRKKRMQGSRPTFEVTLLGCQGGGILNIKGRRGRTIVSNFDETLGYVIHRRSCCCSTRRKVKYSVQDSKNKELFLIYQVASNASSHSVQDQGPGDFEIVDAATAELVGWLSRNWAGEIPPFTPWFGSYGVSFLDQSLDVTAKILLVGALCTVTGSVGFARLWDPTHKDDLFGYPHIEAQLLKL